MNASKALEKTLVASPERKLEADADLSVVRQVQGGDVAAFDRLINKYRERVLGIVYNMTSNREDAADLAQDAFIKAFQSIHLSLIHIFRRSACRGRSRERSSRSTPARRSWRRISTAGARTR